MSRSCDCIVLGVGGFGSGALYHAARRGARVLGLEQFGAAHDRGSSHGETRIIRKAYFEHPDYVPLLRRAYALWRELELESSRSLMHLCGLMLAGPPAGEAISGAKLSAGLHGLNIESVSPEQAAQRFPGFRIPEGFDVVFEADAGYLEVEKCVRAHIEQARAHGAAIQLDETVLDWTSDGRTIRVRTEREEYEAGTLIVTAGAWARHLLSTLHVRMTVLRKPVFWHAVASDVYDLDRGAPAFYFEMPSGAFYGFPSLDGRMVKLAEHTGGEAVDDPARLDRTVRPLDHEPIRQFIEQAMPALKPQPVRHAVCMYTMTPDGHFLVDRHPEHANVVFGAGFSGHGFKFTSVLGEALADLALEGRSELPIGFLRLGRAGLL